MYCLNMTKMFCEVEDVHETRETCQDRALHCLREFISLANELNTTHRLGGEYAFCDNDDKFY